MGIDPTYSKDVLHAMQPLNHYAITTYKQDNNLQWLYIYLSILLPLIGQDKKGVGVVGPGWGGGTEALLRAGGLGGYAGRKACGHSGYDTGTGAAVVRGKHELVLITLNLNCYLGT